MVRGSRRPDSDMTSELEFEEYAPQLRVQTPRLRADAEIIPQTFRGQSYFVLQDPVTLQFYRVAQTEREILAQLDGRTSLGRIHERLREKLGRQAPSFRELAQFVLMLRHANLVEPQPGEEARWGVERAAKKRREKVRQRLSSFMYLTVPLVDPDRLLNAAMPHVRWVFTKLFLIVWVGIVGTAVVVFLLNTDRLIQPANAVLAPDNLLYLWLAFVLIKACHEFGHAFAAKSEGAEVHRMGVMFLIFMPVLYVDTTPVWAFPRKWDKVLVGCAGMMVELLVASLALFAFLSLEPGVLRSVLYNMIFIASVSTVLFNGNPLLRYDGYYILADLVELPNLRYRSTQYVLYLLRRYVVGERVPPVPAAGREKAWFICYGMAAAFYRCFIVAVILLFIASKLFFLGVAMAVVVAVLWVVTPAVKLVKYLLLDKTTRPVRLRAAGAGAVGAAVATLVLAVIPMHDTVRTPCAVEPREQYVLRADWPGFLTEVRAHDGDAVKHGEVIAVIANEEMDAAIVRLHKDIERSEARLRLHETARQAEAQAEAYRLEMLRRDLAQLLERRDSLTVRSPVDGEVIAPDLGRVQGRFLKLGEPIATVASLRALRVTAVVNDADIAAVRNARDLTVRVKLASAPDRTYQASVERVYPAATHEPPPAALTSVAGGKILLDPGSREARRTLLPWYRVDLVLDAVADRPPVGATGTARFTVGSAPLGRQLWLRFRRMIHRRFLT